MKRNSYGSGLCNWCFQNATRTVLKPRSCNCGRFARRQSKSGVKNENAHFFKKTMSGKHKREIPHGTECDCGNIATMVKNDDYVCDRCDRLEKARGTYRESVGQKIEEFYSANLGYGDLKLMLASLRLWEAKTVE